MDAFIGAGIASVFLYAAAKWDHGDKDKIKRTFRNLNYKVNDHEPRLFKTHKEENYTLYTYHVPYGLVDDEKLQVLEKVLNKPVKVLFTNQKLHIKVYNKSLRTEVPYNVFRSEEGWKIPIGLSLDGPVYHDFDKLPHMIVSGTTTWGKTVFMRSLMVHLIEYHPEDAEFYILDLKGGLAFNPYRNLKQIKAVAGDFKESEKVLKMVKKRIKEDMKYLKSIDAENAKEGKIPSRKFIILDEAGELKPESTMSKADKKYAQECQSILSHIARVAGQIGYKLIFGTQYPIKEILNPQIKANAVARVSFRLTTSVQSGVAIDQTGAEKLQYPGRAIYKTVDEYLVQTPIISKKEIWERIGRYNHVKPTVESPAETREDFVQFG